MRIIVFGLFLLRKIPSPPFGDKAKEGQLRGCCWKEHLARCANENYALDTSAILTLRDDEPGAEQVAEFLYQAQDGKITVLICFITLMETFYRVWKDEGEQEGRLAYEQVQSLPVSIIHESKSLLEQAAVLKATYRLSLADAWIGAMAIQEGAILVHKDPEFDALQCRQITLPYKEKL